MTPREKTILRGLIAVAWADGTVKEPEAGLIEGLLWAFDASAEDERELLEYAKKKRTLDADLPLDDLEREDRALLLAHAALLTHADGKQTKGEEKVLGKLIERLGFTAAEAEPVIAEARSRAGKLAERV